MKSLRISGYTFSTTSVPTSPALRVESGTGTYYVNLTTGQRPEALSDQKVFTISTTNYSFLRPFVTSNSFMGYSGVSNNSTVTTGYSGVSNNSTVTTGYAGVSQTRSVDYRWYTIFSVGLYNQLSINTYTYDTRVITKAVFGYTSNTTLINPDIERSIVGATYSTSYTSFVNIPEGYGSMQFNNNAYGRNTYLVGTNVGHTYSTSPEAYYYGGPIGAFSGDFEIRSYAPRVIFYTVRYKMTHTQGAAMALGWVYKGGTIPLRSSGYRPYTPLAMQTHTVGTISFWVNTNELSWFTYSTFTVNNNTVTLQRIEKYGLVVTGTLNSSSTAIGNLSNTTALTKTATRYSSSTAKGYLSSITGLTRSTTRYSSSVAVGNLSNTTELRTITRL